MLAFAGAANATPPADTDHFLWKSIPVAQCKLDDKIPLSWGIYQTADKKQAQYVLVLLGRRYIALDLKAHQAYVVLLSDLTKQGSDLASGDLFVASRVLPTEDWWSLRECRARRIDQAHAEGLQPPAADRTAASAGPAPHSTNARGIACRAGCSLTI